MKEGPGRPPGSPGAANSVEPPATLTRATDAILRFPSPFIVLDPDLNVAIWNHGAERTYGFAAGEMLGRSYLDLIPEPSRGDERDRFQRSLDGIPVPAALVERIARDGRIFPVLNEVALVACDTGDCLAVSDRDLSERLEAEQAREELGRELDHRVKNVLTMVLGILDRTPTASTPSTERFAAAAKGRIGALSAAHQAMAERGGEGADLRELAALLLDGLGLRKRVSVRGPDLIVPAPVVPPLAMAFHELADNAVRHGALSRRKGRVELEWSRDSDGVLCIVWHECDGPPVKEPGRPGFGTRLIQEGIAYETGGRARLDLRPEGARCEIRLSIEGREA